MIFAWSSPLLLVALVSAGAPTEEQAHFFEAKVRPLLARQCLECHGPNKAESEIRLDQRDGVLKLVVADKPAESRLWQVLQYHDDDTQMPPSGKLGEHHLAVVKAWIEMGAPWPTNAKPPSLADSWKDRVSEAQATHWAFQPVSAPPVPRVNQPWARNNPIDSFIQAQLAAAGLTPSAPADARTLLRRLSYDLVGLPPTAAEYAHFAADHGRDPQGAVVRAVDRLLASPHYGERWGRHWLDVARYADTLGYLNDGQDTRYPYAYTYRDYVVNSFNSDLPYDQFLREQLAADLMPESAKPQSLAALGFITTGRTYLSNHDTYDDRIDVVTRGLQGLTVTCARCHDHKFDPLSMADYYALYGVMASAEMPDDLPIIGQPDAGPAYQQYLAGLGKREQERIEHGQEVRQQVLKEFTTETAAYLKAAARAYPKHSSGDDARMSNGQEVRRGGATLWREQLQRLRVAKDPFVALWFRAAESDPGNLGELFAQFLAGTAKGLPHPDTLPTLRDGLRDLKPTTMAGLAEVYAVVLGRVGEVMAGGKNAEPSADERQGWQRLFADQESRLTLHYTGPELELYDWLAGQGLVNRADQTKEKRIASSIRKWQADSDAAPPRAMTLQERGPVNPQIFRRGDPAQRGDRVPRRFLEVLATVDGGKPFPANQSGRLEMAQAIAHPQNPLTARVFVNRVWQQHFGRGLVPTASNFGLQTPPPSHPELLDWLASEFMASGWSTKQLHRLILTSATWQQTSERRQDAFDADPDNRLVWRQTRRRLEWEPTRDTLLAAAGHLDTTLGGRSVNLFKAPFPPRRAVYGFVDRQDVAGVLRVFDFANVDSSNESRPFTTIPQQALYMMNSPFVLEQATRLASHPSVTAAGDDVAGRILALTRQALGRDASSAELAAFREYIAHQTAPPAAGRLSPWEQLALALLVSNELIFVD